MATRKRSYPPFEWMRFCRSPCAVPHCDSTPGSLKYGYSEPRIALWMDTSTCHSDEFLVQFSLPVAPPRHVPSSDRHTLPLLYRLGLNRTDPLPVVIRFILGGSDG